MEALAESTKEEQSLEQELPTACRKTSRRCVAVREALRNFKEQRVATAEHLALGIHREVDRYLTSLHIVDNTDASVAYLQAELQHVLRLPGDLLPVVMAAQFNGESHIVVVYCLHKGGWMGPGMTSVAMRAYRLGQGKLEYLHAAGGEMDGYTDISVLPVRLPDAGREWFLLSGYLTGANGPNLRMRGYLYGESGFQMLWAPANVWARLTLSPWENGFRIDGNAYRTNTAVQEFYGVSEHAVYRDRYNEGD